MSKEKEDVPTKKAPKNPSAKKATTKKKTTKKAAKKAPEMMIGDIVQFNTLFRVKGKQGLFVENSKVNKAGMISMVAFTDSSKKYVAKAMDLVCLGDFVFVTYAGHDDLRMRDVFNNIQKDIGPGIGINLEKTDVEDLMKVMVPNYDPDNFKYYHAKMVAMWYNECATMFEVVKKMQKTEKDDETKKSDKKED